MTKWLIIGTIAVLILFVAISELMEDEYYKGYMSGMEEYEKMMRKEKEDGKESEKESAGKSA